MGKESGNWALAWSWVIEALARSELVDVGLLYELVHRQLGESGIAAKEAAALRCLEGMCVSPNHLPVLSEFRFHPSHTCQHVLHRLWHEIRLPLQTDHLLKDASQELKSSVQTFVRHKKLNSPTCTLELLKNMVLEGSHTFVEEINQLSLADQRGLNIPFNCGDLMCPQSTSAKIPHPSETLLEEAHRCSPRPEIDDVKISNACSGPTKSDNLMQGIDSASHDLDNLYPPAKKLKLQKQCGIKSMQQLSVSSDGSKFPCDIEDESNHPHNIANQTRRGESSVTGQAKTSTENYYIPRMSPSSSGCRHQTDAAMSKAIFSSSQCVFSDDSIALTDTEANLCMKCNEGGQLLSCCGSTCPLLFHESCVGCFVSFDDHGNFYCPICEYSRAVSDYVKAKEKVSFLREELTLFIGGGSNNQPKHDHDRSLDDNVDQQRPQNRENAAGLQDGADAVQVAKSH